MTFISYAQNFEDVLLWRAFRTVSRGFYIDIGAWDPDVHSVTRAFYEKGWSGINVEPVPNMHAALLRKRHRDVNLGVAVSAEAATISFYALEGTGLSTMHESLAQAHEAKGFKATTIQVPAVTLANICRNHVSQDIHFLKIDCEGSERDVLLGADFVNFRPWVILVEAVEPNSPIPNHDTWEPLLTAAEYRFVWFDGLNRYYVAAEWHDMLSHNFNTPPNVFDGFVKAEENATKSRPVPSRPSIAATIPRTLTDDERVKLTLSCRDTDSIPKVDGAGSIVINNDGNRVQVMHNGLLVVPDFYNPLMTHLITLCQGHYEPQKERIFFDVLRQVPEDGVIVELGGLWAYYTAWFLHKQPRRRAVVLEPDPAHLAIGQRNLALNNLSAQFVSGFAAEKPTDPVMFATESSGQTMLPGFSVAQLMQTCGLDHIDILHCDTKGTELDVLEGCQPLLMRGTISWVVVSTHGHLISGDPLTHQRCLALIVACGGIIENEHDVHESFSGDGLIVARFCKVSSEWQPIKLSYNRYGKSLFRNPIYDLAEERELSSPRDLLETIVAAFYRALLLREPDQAGLDLYARLIAESGDVLTVLRLFLTSPEFGIRQQEFTHLYLDQKPSSRLTVQSKNASPVVPRANDAGA